MAAIDKFKAEIIHREFQTLVRDFAAKHGLTAPRGGRTSWGVDSLKLSAELKAVVDAGDGKTPQTGTLIAYARTYGIDPSIQFRGANGMIFRLIDYNPRAHKTPWITEGVSLTGGPTKRYRHATAQIQRECKLVAAAA